MMKKIFAAFLFFAIAFYTQAQETKEEIQKKQKELMQEISELNNTLSQIKKNKKQSLGQLALVQKKINKRQELINNINRDLRRLDDNIYNNQLQIYRLSKELDTLKSQYAKSLVFAYKNRSSYDYLNFLFSSVSFNDAVKRVAYLRSYRQYRETQVSSIVQTQQQIKNQIGEMNSNKTEKGNSLKEQSKQLTVLESDKKEKDQVVKDLKNQENDITGQIKNKEKTRKKLEQSLQAVIRREIEAANKKKQEEDAKKKLTQQQNNNQQKDAGKQNNTAQTATTGVVVPNKSTRSYSPLESTTEDVNNSISFENNRGRLPWPADQGYVSIHFGPYTIPNTKLKGDMPGIELTLPVGSGIKAVADGTVSAIFDLGNSQTVVVKHGKYFTTYNNLSSVSVSRGQEVKAGKVLGKAVAGDTGDGQIIFMVTNDKSDNQDPERWLKPR